MKEILITGTSLLTAVLLLFVWVTPSSANQPTPQGPSNTGKQQDADPRLFLQGEQPETDIPTEVPDDVVQSTPPTITVWYENALNFGQIGNPQTQINILGNVRDPDGSVTSLSYRLNGGSSVSMKIGPDGKRLAREGDFNAAINVSSLQSGTNTLVLTARDNSGDTRNKTVTIQYTPGKNWPIPYSTNWGSAVNIHQQAQVVDGLWQLSSGGLRPVQVGYDRLVAIGSIDWDQFEVLVPVTVHSFYPNPDNPNDSGGVGIIARWQGHRGSGSLPDDWTGIGAYGYYSNRLKGLALRINGNSPVTEDYSFKLSTTYMFKLRAETVSGNGRYSFKIWEMGKPEPSWNSSAFNEVVGVVDSNEELLRGSVLLVAHRTDATFGNVTVCPLDTPTYSLKTNVNGSGSVQLSPNRSLYACGEGVTVTASPGSGWKFSHWSGDISSSNPQISFNMTRSYTITANFTPAEPVDLDYRTFIPFIRR